MKRYLALVLCLVLLVGMAACGGGSGETGGSSDAGGTQSETKQPAASFEEIVVVDNEHCTIKITGTESESDLGYIVNVYLENKASDKTYMFAVDSAAVNGVMAYPLLATEVAAGMKSNAEVSFLSEELVEYGVGAFTDIELSFVVYDNDDWTAEPVAEETVHVYPLGEENATVFTREAQSSDQVLVDNDYVTVIVTGFEVDPFWGYTANLYLVNKTDAEIMVAAEEVSVNGYMADPFYADSVGAGKCAFSSMSWSDATLEENGITEVETISFLLEVYNSEDWTADDYVSENVTLNP